MQSRDEVEVDHLSGPVAHESVMRAPNALSQRSLFHCPSVVLLPLLHSSTTLAGQTRTSSNSTDSVVRFLVSDSFGEPLRQYKVQIISTNQPQKTWTLDSQSGPIRLPYGQYAVKASASLCGPFERGVMVFERELLVAVALTRLRGSQISGDGQPMHEALQGDVLMPNGMSTDRVWVRVASLFGLFLKEGAVSRSGEFKLSDVPNGRYILVVFQGSELLAQRLISPDDVTGKDRILSIQLKDGGTKSTTGGHEG
jgi:hypothetical protein